jgi:porin
MGNLPGGMNLGALFSFDGEFARLDKRFVLVPGQGLTAPTDDESWGVYWTGWQYLKVEDEVTGPVDLADGQPDHQGFGLFSRIGFSDDKTNPAEFAASIGLGGRGVIDGRDDDVFGVGYYYLGIADSRIVSALGFDDDSQGFEAFYNLAVARSTFLSFDVQVLDAPAPDTDTAVVLGMRLNMRF